VNRELAILIPRTDPRFDTLRQARNGRWPVNPADGVGSVALCLNSQDAAEVLQQVIGAGQRPTIRSGGHCYEDFYANNPSGMLMDTSLMDRVAVSPSDGSYRVAAGATLVRPIRNFTSCIT